MSATVTRLGLRANALQFSLLVAINALVGAMVGLERSVLPLVGEREFGLASKGAILAFIVAFGVAKAIANLLAGRLADSVGRKRLLVFGWALALPESRSEASWFTRLPVRESARGTASCAPPADS